MLDLLSRLSLASRGCSLTDADFFRLVAQAPANTDDWDDVRVWEPRPGQWVATWTREALPWPEEP